jgi:hypothetical protein
MKMDSTHCLREIFTILMATTSTRTGMMSLAGTTKVFNTNQVQVTKKTSTGITKRRKKQKKRNSNITLKIISLMSMKMNNMKNLKSKFRR